MLGKLDRMSRKMLTGAGPTNAAEGLARAFARMLGIPDGRAELGYTYISRGEAPDGLARLIPA
ncbi:MAG TPA: hypothetical protein VNS56_00775 [Methylomirabilota bacterium]|nr:hypothetical protein [Methylomirabilota bacterium]